MVEFDLRTLLRCIPARLVGLVSPVRWIRKTEPVLKVIDFATKHTGGREDG